MKLNFLLLCFTIISCNQEKSFEVQIKNRLISNATEHHTVLIIDSFATSEAIPLSKKQLDSAVRGLAIEMDNNMMISAHNMDQAQIKEDSDYAKLLRDTGFIYKKLAEKFNAKQFFTSGGFAVPTNLSLDYSGYKTKKRTNFLFDQDKHLIEIERFIR